eukprot:11611008-Alexandrium_andersonii.AAC.1
MRCNILGFRDVKQGEAGMEGDQAGARLEELDRPQHLGERPVLGHGQPMQGPRVRSGGGLVQRQPVRLRAH